MHRTLRVSIALFLSLLLALPLGKASAHEGITLGDYEVVYGWQNEPPVVGQPNGITLRITPAGAHGHSDEESMAGHLSILSPADGAEVHGDTVEVSVALEGAGDHADDLHWHLYVNDGLVTMSPIDAPAFTLNGLPNGTHTLKASLADADHNEIGEPAVVGITVMGSTATGDALPAAMEGEGHSHDEAPAEEIDVSGLTLEVVFGSETRTLTLRPNGDTPGEFIARLTPTRPGQYTVRIGGQLGGHDVSAEVQPEEVGTNDTYAFPEMAPSLFDLTQQLAAAEARANTSRMIGIAGAVLGLAGLGVGLAALLRRR